MIKRGTFVFFYNKKGFELAKTLLWILIAVIVIFTFGWIVINMAKRIFG